MVKKIIEFIAIAMGLTITGLLLLFAMVSMCFGVSGERLVKAKHSLINWLEKYT